MHNEQPDEGSSSEDNGFSGSFNHKKFKCSIDGCKKKFRKPSFLEIHIRRHNGERPFVCDVENCNNSYTNNAHLKRHKSMVHEGSEELSCDFPGCGLVLSNKYSLKKHKIRTHQEESFSFSCSQCTQKFKKKKLLHEHMLTHNGPAPFRCEKCNLDFYSQMKFTKHKSNHKTFICDCGETFSKWTIFLQHRKKSCKININHKCIICHKVFSTQRNLRDHSLLHLEESRKVSFSCHFPNCSRSYQYKKNLTAHIAAFHEKKKCCQEFVCQEPNCGSVYKYKKNLKEHMEKVHERAKVEGKKARAPRKDEGKPNRCMAAILSGIALKDKDHKELLKVKELENTSIESTNVTDRRKFESATEISEKNMEVIENHMGQNMTIDIVIGSNEVVQDNCSEENASSASNSDKTTEDIFDQAHCGTDRDILSKLCDEALCRIQKCLA